MVAADSSVASSYSVPLANGGQSSSQYTTSNEPEQKKTAWALPE